MTTDATPGDASGTPSEITRRAVKVVAQEREDHRRLLGEFERTIYVERLPAFVTSTLVGDLVWINKTGTDYKHSLQTAKAVLTLLIEGMVGWVDGFARLIEPDRPLPVQASACLRGLLESVLQGCYLLEPGVTTELRLARFAAFILNEAQQSAQVWEKVNLPTDPTRDQWQWRREEIADQQALGMQHDWNKARTLVTGVRLGNERANLSLKISELARDFLPTNPELYSVLSAAAHGQLWSGQGLRRSDPEVILGTATLQFLKMSTLWTQALCDYSGMDPQPMLARTERRHIAMTPRVYRDQEGQ